MHHTKKSLLPPRFAERPIAAFLRRHLRPAAMGVASLSMLATPQGWAGEATLPEVRVQESADTGFQTDSTRGATRTETPLRDIPQTVNIVPQAVIRSQGATTLQDALRNVPGITYGAPEGGDFANQVIMLRGDFALGALFIDGVRDIGEYNRDLFATDLVEVLKGPSGLMFGRGTPNGIINQVSKTADLLPRKEVALTLGSYHTKRGTVDLNLPLNQTTAMRLVALAEDSGSYRYPQDIEKMGFAPSLRFGIGTRTELMFQYYYLKTSDVTDYGQPALINNAIGFYEFPRSARTYYGFAEHDDTDHETNIATIRLDHKFSDTLSLRNTLRWANYKRNMEATIASVNAVPGGFLPATNLSTLTVTRQHNKARDADDGSVINQTELTWKVATGSVKHTLLGGLELAHEKLDRQNYAFGGTFKDTSQPFLGPNPYVLLNYTKTPSTNPVAEADTVALYAQDQMELSKQLKAVLGLRWEHYDTKVKTTNANGTVNSGPVDRVDTMWSGRAGLIWQPTETQSYYVSYGNAYEPSGTLGVYGATGTDLAADSINLEPEKTVVYELGGNWQVFRGTTLRAALFRSEKTNERVDVDPLPGNQFALIGKRRIDGLELDLAGQLTRNWDIYAAVAFMDAKILEGPPVGASIDGNALAVPDHSGNLWTVYRLGGGWEAGGGIFWSSSREAAVNGNGPELPSWTRYDATIAYVQRKYEIRLNLNNLSDELYYVAAYQNSGNRVVPAVPRSATLTVRYNFD